MKFLALELRFGFLIVRHFRNFETLGGPENQGQFFGQQTSNGGARNAQNQNRRRNFFSQPHRLVTRSKTANVMPIQHVRASIWGHRRFMRCLDALVLAH